MDDEKYRRKLVKNMQMLATLVATATYAAAFNPPGGVWQDIHDATGQHLPGDPIMRSTDHGRYVVFFYCNAAAFALSLAVVVLTLLITTPHRHTAGSCLIRKHRSLPVFLMSLMLLVMLALAAAYGAGACRDKLTVAWYFLLVLGPLASFINQIIVLIKLGGGGNKSRSSKRDDVQAAPAVIEKLAADDVDIERKEDEDLKEEMEVLRKEKEDFHKLMVPVSMFALTITYVAGLSTPGGFWDSAEDGHRPGDAILKDRLHGRTLKGFLLSNTLAFTASLYSVSIVMHKRTRVAGFLRFEKRKKVVAGFLARFNFIVVVFGLLCGLLAAYIIASSRGRSSTGLLSEAALGGIVLYVAVYVILSFLLEASIQKLWDAVASKLPTLLIRSGDESRTRKHVQLMAGLAVAITYQAGLYPPGGLWPSNTDGHTAGDPILLTTNSMRYRGFHYSNSFSFVASLLATLLAQKDFLHEHHALEAAMLLDMLGLIGAYAIGSCRDQVSTLYVVGIAGAVVVYVFVHVSYFTLGYDEDNKEDKEVEKMKGRFLIFAILVASMTYQAGLTPPGGFLLKDDAQSGHLAGDPVLRYNYPRRYRAFFYCNSVSFMVSIVIILLLINPIEYKPAIRSHALSVCSVASYVGLMGAFAAGSTQHMKGSIYFFVVGAVVTILFCVAIPLWLWLRPDSSNSNMGPATSTSTSVKKNGKNKNVYLVTLAILVASATYPAGLDPPGGSWQSSSDGHDAGMPMMLDNRRPRYLAFFLSNTTSFLASVILIHMLLPAMVRLTTMTEKLLKLYRKGINGLVYLQCLGFLVAYVAGSSRRWKTSVYTGSALVFLMIIFFSTHIMLSRWRQKKKKTAQPCLSPCSHCSMQPV